MLPLARSASAPVTLTAMTRFQPSVVIAIAGVCTTSTIKRCIVDEDIDAAERRDRRSDHRLYRGTVGDVDLDRQYFSTLGRDFGGDRLRAFASLRSATTTVAPAAASPSA